MASIVKTQMAHQSGKLSLLPWEAAYFGRQSDTPAPLKDALWRTFESARVASNQIMEDGGMISLDDLNFTITRRSQTMMLMDSTFVIEVAATKLVAEQLAQTKLQQSVLQTLPEEGTEMRIEEALAQLLFVKGGPLYNITAPSKRSNIDLVTHMLDQLVKGIPPNAAMQANSFVQMCLPKCRPQLTHE